LRNRRQKKRDVRGKQEGEFESKRPKKKNSEDSLTTPNDKRCIKNRIRQWGPENLAEVEVKCVVVKNARIPPCREGPRTYQVEEPAGEKGRGEGQKNEKFLAGEKGRWATSKNQDQG